MNDEFQMTNEGKDAAEPFPPPKLPGGAGSFSFLNSIPWRLHIAYGSLRVPPLCRRSSEAGNRDVPRVVEILRETMSAGRRKVSADLPRPRHRIWPVASGNPPSSCPAEE